MRAHMPTVRRIGIALLAAGLAACFAVGQAPASTAAAARPGQQAPNSTGNGVARMAAQAAMRGTRTGTLTGVVAGITGAPFGGACITATGPAGSRTVISDPDGRYVLRNLRPGGYRLRIDWCGIGESLAGRMHFGYAWPGLPPVVAVLPGQVRVLATARIWPASLSGPASGQPQARSAGAGARTGSISGRVTGHGRPLADICAVAFHVFTGQNKPPASAATSGRGTYVIRGLRPGRYLVLFRTGERSCPSEANWLPQWYPFLNSPFATDKAAFVRVRAGKVTRHIDGRLRLGGEIAGIVRTSAGQPVKGICVSFYSPFVLSFSQYSTTVTATTSRTGRYALRGLFPGKYQVQFTIGCGSKGNYAAQWWPDKPSPAHAGGIRITRRRVVTEIDATLVPGGAITGTVRARTASAEPLRGVCVYASDNQGDYGDAVTAKNGSYRIVGLDTGTYQVAFDPSCEGFVSAAYLPGQRTVPVRAGETHAGVDVSLRPAAGISGVVRDAAGKPVDACVTIDDQNSDYAFTKPNGSYSIGGVVPGHYSMYVEDCGDQGSLAPQWYDNEPDSDSANLLTFTGGTIDRDIDFTLHPGGTLAGILTSAAGKPVRSGDCVGLAAPQNAASIDSFSGGGATGRGGRYRFADLSPGEYQVSFDCLDGRYADQWFNSQPDSTTAEFVAINPGVTTRLNQKLSLAGGITGTVTSKAGRPIAGICVDVANARNKEIINQGNGGVLTGRRGRYLVGQLAPGRYLVQFSDCQNGVYGSRWYHGTYREALATPVVVRAGQTTSRINAALTIGGSIAGTVTGPSGRPANGTCVYAYDPASQSYGVGGTNAAGHYTVPGLGNGRYAVSFYACDSQSPNLGSVVLGRLVQVVAPRRSAGVSIELAAGGSITGTVSGPSGPQTQACVVAVPTNPSDVYALGFTDQSGAYVLPALAAGTYRVELGDLNCDFYEFGMPGLAPQWYDDQPGPSAAALVTVGAGQVTAAVSGTLQPFGGIDGVVTDQRDAGVSGECVTAVPVDAPADPVTELTPAPDIAITRASGRYRLLDLPPGSYKIEFSTGCGDTGFATQWWDNAGSARSATVISVGATTTSGIDATLRR
jgi:hypothetical protein